MTAYADTLMLNGKTFCRRCNGETFYGRETRSNELVLKWEGNKYEIGEKIRAGKG
jgi:hypothetical protein